MRRLPPLVIVLACVACGSTKTSSAPPPTTVVRQAPLVHVDLAAAARKLFADGSAHVVYDLRVEPVRPSALQFVTHAEGDFDFAHDSASYVSSTPLGEAMRTIVVRGVRYARSLGGGAAGRGNPATPWKKQSGPDLSPAGVAALVPLAATGTRDVRRIGAREYEATVVVARTKPSAREFLLGTLGGARGTAQFVLDGHGRLVGVRLLNTRTLAARTLVFGYAYTRLGEPVRVKPPVG